jgi:Coenzyme PQQ synthesis protein D (PqqD)
MQVAPANYFLTRSRSVVSRVVAGETLIVPIRGKVGDLASIYSFNRTGSLIWQVLDKPATLADIADAMEREYEICREQAEKDAKRFLDEMLAVGLLEIRSVAAIAAEPHATVSVSLQPSSTLQTETSTRA